MKLYKLIWAVALLSLASCSKDAEPSLDNVLVSQETSGAGQSDEETPTEKIRLELGATQDDESLRAIYNLATDGSGGITGLDRIGNDNLRIRIYIRRHERDGDRSAMTVQDITLRREAGRNYGTYVGDVDVPVRTKNTVKYMIASGLLSSETLDLLPGDDGDTRFYDRRDILKYTLKTSAFGGSTVYENGIQKLLAGIPYVTDWQDFPRTSTTAPTKVILKFKPFGTIYRMRVYNDTNRDIEVYSLDVSTNVYSQRGMFNFAEGETSPSWEPDYGRYSSEIGNYFGRIEFPKEGSDRTTKLRAKQYTPWLYYVVFPRQTTEPVRTVTRLRMAQSLPPDQDAHLLFGTSEYMSSNKSISTTFVYSDTPVDDSAHDYLRVRPAPGSAVRPSKLAIEYVADRCFNESGTGFVASAEETRFSQVGYFSYTEAVQRFGSPLTIGGKKYSLPTASEMRSIFPPDIAFWGLHGAKSWSGYVIKGEIEPNIKIGGSPESTYLADYNRPTGESLYAIRLQDATDTHRSAFRYRNVELRDFYGNSQGRYLQVDCIWLGASSHTIEDISTPSFWQDHESEIISKKFPLYGYIPEPNVAVEQADFNTMYWTSTTMSSGAHGSSYAAYITNPEYGAANPVDVRLCINFTRLPVRPFIRD